MEALVVTSIAVVFLFAVGCVFTCVWCFKKGVEYGRALKEDKPLKPVVDKKPKPMTEEEIKARKAMTNWFGYNGDPIKEDK